MEKNKTNKILKKNKKPIKNIIKNDIDLKDKRKISYIQKEERNIFHSIENKIENASEYNNSNLFP